MPVFQKHCLLALWICSLTTTGLLAEDRAALEAAFQKKLSGAVLKGSFSVVGPNAKPATEERYEIVSLQKGPGDNWIFSARIKYGKVDTIVPLSLPVQWAGDTPVITLTDFTIPNMGTFTARVMFHGDRYAGTWQHDAKGGHMWGLIEPKADAKPEAKTEAQ